MFPFYVRDLESRRLWLDLIFSSVSDSVQLFSWIWKIHFFFDFSDVQENCKFTIWIWNFRTINKFRIFRPFSDHHFSFSFRFPFFHKISKNRKILFIVFHFSFHPCSFLQRLEFSAQRISCRNTTERCFTKMTQIQNNNFQQRDTTTFLFKTNFLLNVSTSKFH